MGSCGEEKRFLKFIMKSNELEGECLGGSQIKPKSISLLTRP